MDALLTTLIPLFSFMLIPVWIPLIAVVAGTVVDRVRPPAATPAEAAVRAAKDRSAARRASAPGAAALLAARPSTRLAA